MQEPNKFCSACGQQNHISAACCHRCKALFLDLQNIEFKKSATHEKPQYRQEVVVVDFNMSFGSMIMFMVKWAFASIPAMIIMFIIGMILIAILGGLGGALGALSR